MPLESSCNGLFISHNKWMKIEKTQKSRLPLQNVVDLEMFCKTDNYCESHFYITCFAVSTMVSQQHIFTKPVDGCSTSKMAANLSLSFFIFLFLPDSFLLSLLHRTKKRASWGDSSFVPSGRLANSIGFSYNTIISCFIFVVCVQG